MFNLYAVIWFGYGRGSEKDRQVIKGEEINEWSKREE